MRVSGVNSCERATRASLPGLDPGSTIQKSRLAASRKTWQRTIPPRKTPSRTCLLRVLALNWDLDLAVFRLFLSFSLVHCAVLGNFPPFPIFLSDRVHWVLGFGQFHPLFPSSLLSCVLFRNCVIVVPLLCPLRCYYCTHQRVWFR